MFHIIKLLNYMLALEAFDGASPVFGILVSYEEWNIFAFDDIVSNEVLFKSDQANNKTQYSTISNNSDNLLDEDNDVRVKRNLIVSKPIACTDPILIQSLVSIMIKCYNRRTNGSSNAMSSLVSLLKPDRIALKVKSSSISWIKISNTIKQLSLMPPVFANKGPKELLLLRDFREGSEGKAWLGCSKSGNIVIIKFFKGVKGKSKEEIKKDSIVAINKECETWNKLYGANTAKALELDNQLALVMPFVFCCIYDCINDIGYKKFNSTLQPSRTTNDVLLGLDLREVKEFQIIREEISKCNPDIVASSIINQLADKGYIHNDIAWRHIGVRPIFNPKTKRFDHLEPILIDLSSVVKY